MNHYLPVQKWCLRLKIEVAFRYLCLACTLAAVILGLTLSTSRRCLAMPTSPPPKEQILSTQDQELITAVRRSDIKAVNSLLEQDANVNLIDDKELSRAGTPTHHDYVLPLLILTLALVERARSLCLPNTRP